MGALGGPVLLEPAITCYSTPSRQPTPSRPNSRLGAGCSQGKFTILVIEILNRVCERLILNQGVVLGGHGETKRYLTLGSMDPPDLPAHTSCFDF
jgi:hypothetical protein